MADLQSLYGSSIKGVLICIKIIIIIEIIGSVHWWTTGMPKKVSNTVSPAFFVLGSVDEISKRSPAYQKILKDAGVNVFVKEYEGGEHPFISSPYPELAIGMTDNEKKNYITDEQKKIAYEAEDDIKEWINNIKK